MDDELKFSWNLMFVISGFSFFFFSFIIKFLEGSHSQLLLMIGSIALGLGISSWILKTALDNTSSNKKKKRLSS